MFGTTGNERLGGSRSRRGGILALALVLAAAPSPAQDVSGPARVTDGDTLAIGRERVRIFGIDAPEAGQSCGGGPEQDWACGRVATARLRELVAGRTVRCSQRDRDRYGRMVAVCEAGGVDLGRRMVSEGLARAYTRFGDDYAEAEARAKTERLGLWHNASQAPWDWRAETRPRAVPAATEPPDPACAVKGNVSASGARIYHLPGSRDYARTRIDPRKGEAWFCSAEEAEIAGWRAPR